MRTISIKSAREAKEMTQQELAEILGVKQSAVAKWETGANGPVVKRLPVIAKVLDCSVEELLNQDNQDEENGEGQGEEENQSDTD